VNALYGFEAKSIQRYILLSGKLRDMGGASEIVNDLCETFLRKVCTDLGLEPGKDLHFARKAGGALIAFFEEEPAARAFRDLWTLRVQRQAPGLGFVDALVPVEGSAKAAVDRLRQQMNAARNRDLASLPLTSPLAKRYDRTGLVAVDLWNKETIDAATRAKREIESKELVDRLKPPDLTEDLAWVVDLMRHEDQNDTGPFMIEDDDEKSYVGIIHADGNGLGKVLEVLAKDVSDDQAKYAEQWSAFSEAVETATQKAFTRAMAPWLTEPDRTAKGEPIMRARPIILGGDDLTVIVRADLALPFTRDFLIAFEEQTAAAFRELAPHFPSGLPEKLTACAGIAFIKARQPFHQAYRLAESLCDEAKRVAKAAAKQKDAALVPATLAFHRITTGMIDSWDEIVPRELTGPRGLRLTMQPYALTPGGEIAGFSDLLALHDTLAGTSRGAVRELARLLRGESGEWRQALHRWEENMAKDNQSDRRDVLRANLAALTRDGHTELEGLLPIYDSDRRSPLGDALALRGIGGLQ